MSQDLIGNIFCHICTKLVIIVSDMIGVRRSGKSTFMFQIMQSLLDNGVSRQNLLYLNFFDDRLHNQQYSGLNLISEAYYSHYPERKTAKRSTVFDEIQAQEGWEPFVDRLIAHGKCALYITGSLARMLAKEIAPQRRNRLVT